MRRCAIKTTAMSQQINLLNPAFRKTFDWLSATPVAVATLALLVVLGGASAWAGMRADERERSANQRAEALKQAQDRLLAMTKSIAESKPNQQLAAELANTRAMLHGREEILKVLEGGAFANTDGFAEFLRGFSRQAPKGLWLTSFTIGAGGTEMEIHGRMLNPASLPEYISHLKNEKVFQGRSFASLTIQRPEESKEKKPAAGPTAASTKPTGAASAAPQVALPSFVDFVLLPSAPNPVAPATTAAVTPSVANLSLKPDGLFSDKGDAAAPNLANLSLLKDALNAGKGTAAASPQPTPEKKP